MSYTLTIPQNAPREEVYEHLVSVMPHLIDPSVGVTANLANFAALLNEAFDFLWVGFYITKGEELILGPFQGPVACTRIAYGRGVCGGAWQQEKTLVVEDVEEFPGHIACSSLSVSEVVVPVFSDNKVVAVLDIDSVLRGDFSELDAKYLERLVEFLAPLW